MPTEDRGKEPEGLDCDLEEYLEDGTIHHPLLAATGVSPRRFGELNALYRAKLVARGEAISANDWRHYVFLHERPYRAEALSEVAVDLADGQYWELLSDVWIDSENIWQNLDTWKALWSSSRPQKPLAMTDDEQTAFAALPDKLAIYRGTRTSAIGGLSWTLDREKAIWFARRSNGDLLVEASAVKADAHALFLRRKEQEIVVGKCQVIRQEPLISPGLSTLVQENPCRPFVLTRFYRLTVRRRP